MDSLSSRPPLPTNLFKRPMTDFQKKWHRLLIARRFGYGEQTAQPPKVETYQDVCQKRYTAAFRRYNEKFRREIKQHEAMQPSAVDAMRVHRTFAITTLWPPLHSKCEINLTLQRLEKILSVKERRRLEEILKRSNDPKRFWRV